VLDRLTTRAAAEELDTALDYVTQHLANGGIVLDIAKSLSGELKFPVSSATINRALGMESGDDNAVQSALSSARKLGATASVEEARQIADDVELDKDHIAKAKLRSEIRTWTAERFNREQFGATKAQPVAINIGTLHIDALRLVNTDEDDSAPRLAPAPNDAVEQAEVLAIEDAINSELAEAIELDALLE
jgi:hypothetical protein